MQINNLNKTVNLIVLGACATVNLIIIDYLLNTSDLSLRILDFLRDSKISDSQTLTAIFSISLILFIGLTIESMTRLMVSWISVKKFRLYNLCLLFNVKAEYLKYINWRRKLKTAISTKPELKGKEVEIGALLFFENAKDASISWVTTHFVTHMLSAGISLLLFIDFVVFLIFAKFSFAIFSLLLLWFTVSQSLDKFYYSYGFLFRFSYFKFLEYFPKTNTLNGGISDIESTEIESIDRETQDILLEQATPSNNNEITPNTNL